jgi:hypothetical protein
LAGYIQNHTLIGDAGRVEGLGSGDEPFDGVTTAYFNSVVQFRSLVGSPLAAEESFADEQKFIDHAQTISVLTRRHVMKDIVR